MSAPFVSSAEVGEALILLFEASRLRAEVARAARPVKSPQPKISAAELSEAQARRRLADLLRGGRPLSVVLVEFEAKAVERKAQAEYRARVEAARLEAGTFSEVSK